MTIDTQKTGLFLDNAQRTATAVPQFEPGAFDLETAYRIQQASIAARFQRGEKPVGMKMGFTSRAKMVQMGVHDMICGWLTDKMLVEDGGVISHAAFVHPRVEPEIAFLLKRTISGPLTPMQAMDAVEAVAPALEIIDSRYQNFKFSLEDVVADNSSSSGFVVGAWHRPDTDLDNLGMIMSVDGRQVEVGSSAAILGHPARSLAAAARLSLQCGIPLEAGSIVLAGGATAAVALKIGHSVTLEVQNLGRCGFTVEA
ncbi:MAG: 4-oxalocrotonate decarboxylase [Sphingomonadales bacterium]|nr:MAG: 4-oxalocrotonate decarboxylase [Sphingomonadales bacterium]